jgi:hypothetical protein
MMSPVPQELGIFDDIQLLSFYNKKIFTDHINSPIPISTIDQQNCLILNNLNDKNTTVKLSKTC